VDVIASRADIATEGAEAPKNRTVGYPCNTHGADPLFVITTVT
jgi:hypothetical protein